MQIALNAAQMMAAEKYTIEELGYSSLLLMERAALGAREEIMTLYSDRLKQMREGDNVIVFCGYGNNGADGIALARLLQEVGISAHVILLGNPEKATREHQIQLELAFKYGVSISKYLLEEVSSSHGLLAKEAVHLQRAVLVVDALFGIGLRRELSAAYQKVIGEIRKLQKAYQIPCIALDIPSGLEASAGRVLGDALCCDITITFGIFKTGLFLGEGPNRTGRVILKEIGIQIPEEISKASVKVFTQKEAVAYLPERKPCSHKGTYGKVLAFVGSETMAGAAYLALSGIWAMGTGMVKVLTPPAVKNCLFEKFPETMWSCDLSAVQELDLTWPDYILVGCGLGQEKEAEAAFLWLWESVKQPMIVDADGLNLLCKHPEVLSIRKNKGYRTILTPHVGELKRLFAAAGMSADKGMDFSEDPLAICRRFSEEYGFIVVSKDAKTLIISPDEVYLNLSGNPGMASAGSGDLLAGMLTGLFAITGKAEQKNMHMLNATAAAGVYLHGMLGDMAKQEYGENYMRASHILEMLEKTRNKEFRNKELEI